MPAFPSWKLFNHANFAACPSVSYRTGLEGLYLAAFNMPASLAEKNESTRRIVQTLAWFTLALIISVYVTDIQYAISLIGGLAALYIFFFPGKQISYNKTSNKRKNRALLTLRRSQKHYEIFSNNVLRKNITRKQLRLETIEIA